MKTARLTAAACAALLCFTRPVYAEAETFSEVLVTAYQNNPELAAARAKLRAEDEQVAVALSGWRPDVEASAQGGRSQQRISGNSFSTTEGTLSSRNVGVSVTQPVFSGFRTTSQMTSAEAAVKAARADLQDAEQKLLFNTAKAYLDVVEAEDILALNRDNEDVLQKKLSEVEDRLRIKDLTKTDLSQAQSRLSAATVSRLQAEGDLAQQRTTYARITGEMPGLLAAPDIAVELPASADAAIDTAIQKNPAVVSASYGAQSAHANITTAKSGLLPAVDIVGQASHALDQSLTSPEKSDNAAILVRFTVPLYKTGEDYARTRAAQQTALQKRLETDDTRNKAREQAANAWQALMTARDSKKGNETVVTATTDALSGVQMEAKFGTRTTLDVLNAQQEVLNAKISLARAVHDEKLAMLQLKAAVGDLTAEALKLPVAPYDPLKNYNQVRNKWAGFSDVKE